MRQVGVVCGIWMMLAGVAWGQGVSPVGMSVLPEDVGLGGRLRAGTWTPLRVTLTNLTAEPRRVRCEWVVPDGDSDRALMGRSLTLSPNAVQFGWVYAALPSDLSDEPSWPVRLVDEASGRVLEVVPVRPGAKPMDRREVVVGVVGRSLMGLENYRTDATQHAAVSVVSGLTVDRMPDRAWGYEMLDALVWTPEGDPSDAGFTSEAQRALRAWVQGGGHLVIVLPMVGSTWSDSTLADLLPPVTSRAVTAQLAPFWLGALPAEGLSVDMRVFEEPAAGSGVAVLLRSRDVDDGEPVAIAHRVGMGRVTVVGLDVSDARLPRQAPPLPNGSGVWGALLGWKSPAYHPMMVESMIKSDQVSLPHMRDRLEQSGFLADRIAMRRTASTILMLAMFVFAGYWLLAGPVSFFVLKGRKLHHHSWLGFTLTVGLFAGLSWGGALLLRPNRASVQHVSVVDFLVGRGTGGSARVHSWLTLSWPSFGQASLTLGEGPGAPGSGVGTLASPGLPGSSSGVGYLTQSRYAVDAGDPMRMDVPMRASAKSFEASYRGLTENEWPTPRVVEQVALDAQGQLTGRLSHALPGTLRNVVVVVSGGVEGEVKVWRVGDWEPEPGELVLSQPKQPDEVLAMARPMGSNRWEGFIPSLIAQARPGVSSLSMSPSVAWRPDRIAASIELLSLYQSLPPPDYHLTDLMGQRTTMVERLTGQAYDLSAQLALPCVIVMGHLDESTLPLPLRVAGDRVPSTGWTTVRCVLPIQGDRE